MGPVIPSVFASLFLSIAAHHGEADPRLLAWIKDLLDQLIGLGPWTVVALIGSLILAMPIGLSVFYLVQQRRAAASIQDRVPFSDGQ